VDPRGHLQRAREQILLVQLQSTPAPTQEQAIEEDKGKDLVERLGKINAFHAKEEQKVKTAKFLANYGNVIKAEEFKVLLAPTRASRQRSRRYTRSPSCSKAAAKLAAGSRSTRNASRKAGRTSRSPTRRTCRTARTTTPFRSASE
jgi:hypothetical protein